MSEKDRGDGGIGRKTGWVEGMRDREDEGVEGKDRTDGGMRRKTGRMEGWRRETERMEGGEESQR